MVDLKVHGLASGPVLAFVEAGSPCSQSKLSWPARQGSWLMMAASHSHELGCTAVMCLCISRRPN